MRDLKVFSPKHFDPPTADDLLRESEAAKILDLSIYTLQSWRSRRYGPPFVKLSASGSGGVRYRRADLQSWIASRRVETG